MEKITLLLADDNEYMRFVIKEMLQSDNAIRVIGEAQDGKEVLETIKVIKPEVIVMDVGMPVIDGLEATRLISQYYSDINIILISINDERHYFKEAMQAGAKEYLIKPIVPNDLIRAIKTVATFSRKRLGVDINQLDDELSVSKDAPTNSTQEAIKTIPDYTVENIPQNKHIYADNQVEENVATKEEKGYFKNPISKSSIISAVKNITGLNGKREEETNSLSTEVEISEESTNGVLENNIEEQENDFLDSKEDLNSPDIEIENPKVISVFGTKGGVGKSIVCSNLAVALAQKYKNKVGLIDLDIQFGDIGVILNVNPKKTFSELVLEEDLTQEILEEYLYESNRIKLLAAPNKPEFADLVTPDGVEQVIKLFKKMHEYIFIDTPSFIDDKTLAALEASDLILLVVSLDLPTISNMKKSIDILKSLSLLSKTRLIINRSTGANGIDTVEIEKVLEMEVMADIASDGKLVTTSLNRGVPFVRMNPKAEISKNIKSLMSIVEGYN
ncbi:hypothetical protein SYNTR_1516 [Candidatus Syntrophocurvum alkaliphilum]|uniref:Stage 0 sporulation protein A homolog n=1 Tax=Candidatus Syntrophocurvum alkaliphilum TaxID=2293317 RepID=A0A6I6DD36_9FIRM|nr:response regulator [Candidatus Syntrophocurvum alkaliphilum]QGU00110.1 hypothetical protein SYNTR_1516 [Candidatus Syntrophocurvum alkaliphilum]